MLNRKGKPMKTLVARSFSTKEYTLEQIKEIMEQEASAALARKHIQSVDELMQQIVAQQKEQK
jgi:CRISPR/Cas system-associated endonuclease Cas1